jgi:hypothetical protein
MIRYTFVLALMSLLLCTPVMAQDDIPATDEVTTEEAAEPTPAAEEAVEAEPAPEEDAAAEVEETPAEELVDEIESIEEAAEEAFALIDAIKSKNWPLVVGLSLMLLVFVANKLGLKNLVGPKAVPWVALGIAVAGTIGTGLMAGLGWVECILQGVLTGAAAIGGWELLKGLFSGKAEAPAE